MSRTEYYNGGLMSPFWWYDKETEYHSRFSVKLDHNIDSEKLSIAWDKTKRVYPLIDCVPELVNGEIIFYKDEKDNPPLKSSKPIKPGTDACARRAFAVTYYENKITLCLFHSVVDGGGLNMIFCTLIYFYLELYTGEGDENPPVETRENRSPEEYFKPLTSIEIGNFERKSLITYKNRKGMFIDLDMTANEQGDIEMARIKVPVDEFMSVCKNIGANPSSMMTILMAKAAYNIHPERRGDLAFVLTMSARKAFGVPDTIANCSTNVLIPVEYEDIMGEDISKAAKKIRSLIDYQRSSDFIKTFVEFYETYDWILAKRYAVLTYIGKVDIGKNAKHIIGFEMSDDAVCTMYLMELQSEFIISFLFGKVTKKYMEEVINILSEFGLKAEVETLPYHIMKESDFVVSD